ncbi:MAG: 6-phosphogluconolactonase [Nitrospirales bacterium]
MSRRIYVCQTQEDLFEAAAQIVVQAVSFRREPDHLSSVALSGGSTPQGLFARLVAEPFRSQVDWSSIHVFWGDEREVPPDHADSNFRMAKEHLLDRVPIPMDQVFRMEGECQAQDAADRYEDVLQRVFSLKNKEVVPRFDLILLGMGPDGHTASLFPETSVLRETTRWVAAPWVEKLHTHRITLTPPVLNAAHHIVFVVSGLDKSLAVQAVLEGPSQPSQFPAQLVNPVQGEVIWLLDSESASQLQQTSVTKWQREIGMASG